MPPLNLASKAYDIAFSSFIILASLCPPQIYWAFQIQEENRNSLLEFYREPIRLWSLASIAFHKPYGFLHLHTIFFPIRPLVILGIYLYHRDNKILKLFTA